jgi:hypothetical protein
LVPLDRKLTFVFTGLCAFVPGENDSRLDVLLVDASKDSGKDDPPHGAALAILRFGAPGVLSGYPTVKPLNGEELRITKGQQGSVHLEQGYLVNMGRAANCPAHPDHGKAHDDSKQKDRNVVARLSVDGSSLGTDLFTERPAQSAAYEFKQAPGGPVYYKAIISDELRLWGELPTTRLCMEAGPLTDPTQTWWSQELFSPGDWATVVVLSNLPIHLPFGDGSHSHGMGKIDHHFKRYYPLAQEQAHAPTAPEVSGMVTWPRCTDLAREGGAVPRCAMAVFDR